MSRVPESGPAPAPSADGDPAFAGRLLVRERLGLDSHDLWHVHAEPGELRTLARLVQRQADRVDEADKELRRTADRLIARLARTKAGDHREIQSWGLLRTLGSDIETLAARYDFAVEQLGLAMHVYKQAAKPAAGADRRDAALSRASAPTTGRPPPRRPLPQQPTSLPSAVVRPACTAEPPRRTEEVPRLGYLGHRPIRQ
ncbi:hypothetical protein [Kitasatospora sp. NPDC057015]|uniref:hypothetical protein n=1 Tax=Kitasatospora sp. NPDC057015 TaxID=3346001 RepID=UPI00363FDA30